LIVSEPDWPPLIVSMIEVIGTPLLYSAVSTEGEITLCRPKVKAALAAVGLVDEYIRRADIYSCSNNR
jgi:hypothetical protein